MSQQKEISEVLVYFYNYDGVVSDEKFVPLYDEIYLSLLLLKSECSSLHWAYLRSTYCQIFARSTILTAGNGAYK